MPSPTLQKKIEGVSWEFPQPLFPTHKLSFAFIFSYFSAVNRSVEVSLFYLRPSPQIFALYPVTSGISVVLVKIMVAPVTDKPGKIIGLIKYIYVSFRSNPVGNMGRE